jgi:hypothetical protein
MGNSKLIIGFCGCRSMSDPANAGAAAPCVAGEKRTADYQTTSDK